MALRPLPATPYVITQRHLRYVGKDCLVAFDANLYSVPARKVRPRQLVEVRATKSQITLHSTVPDANGETLLSIHPRAVGRGAYVVDEKHWDGLPDGRNRRTTTGDVPSQPRQNALGKEMSDSLTALLNRAAAVRVEVGRRPLSVYDELTGTRPFTTPPHTGGAQLSELVSTRIRSTAAKLGLPHLAESLNQYAGRADEAKMGYLDFLDLVLAEELAIRDDRRFRQGLRLSKLPHHKTLDEYDFAFQPELDPRKIKDLATLAFVEAKANAALLGPPGVGKTHIAVALSVAACRAGFSVYFTTLDDMVRQLKVAEAAGRLNSKLRTYLRPGVLVVDEVGYQPLERAEANLVFQVISKRYEKGSIILTSNKTFSEWGQVFGDEVLATAILDRLLHHCDVVSINGPSYRLKNRIAAIERDTNVA